MPDKKTPKLHPPPALALANSAPVSLGAPLFLPAAPACLTPEKEKKKKKKLLLL
jgi:hypothetical protein